MAHYHKLVPAIIMFMNQRKQSTPHRNANHIAIFVVCYPDIAYTYNIKAGKKNEEEKDVFLS